MNQFSIPTQKTPESGNRLTVLLLVLVAIVIIFQTSLWFNGFYSGSSAEPRANYPKRGSGPGGKDQY